MNVTKKILVVLLSTAMLLCSLPMSVFATTEDVATSQNSEAHENTIEIGDYITLGTYLGEPIVWRCVDIDDNGPLMLSDKILCFKAFDAKGEHGNYYRNKEGTNNWNNSCLRHWLNTGNLIDWNTQTTKPSAENVFNGYNPYDAESGFMASFTDEELTLVKEIEQITYINELDRASADGGSGEYSPVSGGFGTSLANLESKFSGKMYQTSVDKFFAIDLIQAKNIYENLGGNYLTATPTTSAIANYNGQGDLTSDSCYKYWLRSPSTNGMSYEVMMIVDSTEQINYMSAASVLNGNQYHAVGVRPAFYLNLDNYDGSYDTTEKVVIYEREFDENIDYYTAECNSSEYNPTLANMLAALSAAAYNKTKIQEAYESLGFDFDETKKYGSYDYDTTDPFRCGYTISLKKSEYTDDIICLITVRGTSTIYNLIGDCWIDITADGKHAGFAYAANYIYLALKNSLPDQSELQNIKYVITGHSLGGAVGNLLSVDLMEKGVAAENIYNYNFACPDVACLKSTPVSYNNIFNLCNTEDPIPYLPGEPCNTFTNDDGAWWVKYGQTYWFTHEDEKIEPFSNHAIDLYLEFLNQSLEYSEFPYSLSSDLALWFAKILCPVDVIITDTEGNQVASVINGKITYYDSSFEELIFVFTDGDKKVVYIQDDAKFNVDLIGTDNGTMTFELGKYNLATEELSESKTFNDVVLEEGKTMYCSVDETTEIDNVSLFVVEEKNGEIIYTHTIGTDGTETPMIETDSSNSSTGNEDPNKSKPSDTLGENNDASIFDRLESISKETIIIVAASVVGAILLIIICVIIKKKKG